MGNCFAYRLADMTPLLGLEAIKDLPLNTTSKIQLCDAKIIEAMKAYYRLFQMKRAID